jgi:hypothetical protein
VSLLCQNHREERGTIGESSAKGLEAAENLPDCIECHWGESILDRLAGLREPDECRRIPADSSSLTRPDGATQNLVGASAWGFDSPPGIRS